MRAFAACRSGQRRLRILKSTASRKLVIPVRQRRTSSVLRDESRDQRRVEPTVFAIGIALKIRRDGLLVLSLPLCLTRNFDLQYCPLQGAPRCFRIQANRAVVGADAATGGTMFCHAGSTAINEFVTTFLSIEPGSCRSDRRNQRSSQHRLTTIETMHAAQSSSK